MGEISRRVLLAEALAVAVAGTARSQDRSADPWGPDTLIQPEELARILSADGPKPMVISVAFPVLYRQRHIVHALPAGPTSKPEGLAALRQTLAALRKDANIVIYCGCCPMAHCPNIRPAYIALADAGFHKVRVLNLPTNLHTDWIAKGYPTEPPV
jgi:hypothetical protein